MKFSKEIKTGLLAIISIALLVVGYNFLKGKNIFNNVRTFYAVYDNVEGLGESSPVTVNGLKIGKVQNISISDKDGKLTVEFNVESDFTFSKNSIARIYGGGIIGGKSLAIVPEFDSAETAKNGDYLKGEIEEGIMELVNDKLSPLQQKIENATVSADSLLTSLNTVFDEQNKNNLKETLANINEMTASFKNAAKKMEEWTVGNDEKINRSISNLDRTTENFANLSDSLAQLEIGKMVNDIEKTIAEFRTMSEKLNQPEGTIGKLINDDELYTNLEGATRQLEQLLQDMKLNPKRYVHFSVFGKRAKEYEKPENRED